MIESFDNKKPEGDIVITEVYKNNVIECLGVFVSNKIHKKIKSEEILNQFKVNPDGIYDYINKVIGKDSRGRLEQNKNEIKLIIDIVK